MATFRVYDDVSEKSWENCSYLKQSSASLRYTNCEHEVPSNSFFLLQSQCALLTILSHSRFEGNLCIMFISYKT